MVFILSWPWLVDLNAITGKFTARKIQELELLNNIQEALKIATSLEELRLLWEQPTSH